MVIVLNFAPWAINLVNRIIQDDNFRQGIVGYLSSRSYKPAYFVTVRYQVSENAYWSKVAGQNECQRAANESGDA